MPSELDRTINLLGKERSKVEIEFGLTHLSPFVGIETYEVWLRTSHFEHGLYDPSVWERLGAAIGRNTALRNLKLHRNRSDDVDNMDNHISGEVFQCIEALHRGLQLNNSIYYLVIDMDLFPCDGSLPTLNLQDAQFKERLKSLQLKCRQTISNNQSVMIKTFLESTFLEEFDVEFLEFENANESAFQRIILACSRVKRLVVGCGSLSQSLCDSVANLLGIQGQFYQS